MTAGLMSCMLEPRDLTAGQQEFYAEIVTIQPCHLGFTQLTLLTAANKAESSIQAKHPMSEDGKSSLQASLLQAFALLSRMAE